MIRCAFFLITLIIGWCNFLFISTIMVCTFVKFLEKAEPMRKYSQLKDKGIMIIIISFECSLTLNSLWYFYITQYFVSYRDQIK